MEQHKRRITLRLDERTAMLLNELSNITKMTTSVIIRGMVHRSIEELIDKSGNWKMPNEKDKKIKMNITAEEYLEEQTKWFEYVQENLIEPSHARIAIAMVRSEMKEKAIESYIENCEYKSDWCCGCAEAHGAILAEPDVCKGIDCPSVKLFIEKLNS